MIWRFACSHPVPCFAKLCLPTPGTFGSYLLAIYDPDTEEYQTISKIGTGFKDEELVQLSEEMSKHKIDEPKIYYR